MADDFRDIVWEQELDEVVDEEAETPISFDFGSV